MLGQVPPSLRMPAGVHAPTSAKAKLKKNAVFCNVEVYAVYLFIVRMALLPVYCKEGGYDCWNAAIFYWWSFRFLYFHDEFQNLIPFSLFGGTSVVKLSWRYVQ